MRLNDSLGDIETYARAGDRFARTVRPVKFMEQVAYDAARHANAAVLHGDPYEIAVLFCANAYDAALVAVFYCVVYKIGKNFAGAGPVGCDGWQIAGDFYGEDTVLAGGAQLHVVADGVVDIFD